VIFAVCRERSNIFLPSSTSDGAEIVKRFFKIVDQQQIQQLSVEVPTIVENNEISVTEK
jgi:hypothetical protein